MADAVLDNAVWWALNGPHAAFAHARGTAARYDPRVSVWAGLADYADPQAWRDLAELVGPQAEVVLSASDIPRPPRGWEYLGGGKGPQLIDVRVDAEPDDEAVVLGADDVPEMLGLVERTKPGPFRDRTVELGMYLGIRRRGRLVAMAGERMHPPGWTEISAVCTDPEFRGQGLARRLVRAVVHNVNARGERAMLHTHGENIDAIRLYVALGFEFRSKMSFVAARSPRF